MIGRLLALFVVGLWLAWNLLGGGVARMMRGLTTRQCPIRKPFSIRGIEQASLVMTRITAKTGQNVEVIGDGD